MREADILSELRAALRRRGVWGARAERLLQEWTEHVRDDAAQRVENGADPEAAQEAAWQALGGPDVLAAAAAHELTRASWLGRHPWLGGLALPMLGWICAVVAVVAIPSITSLLGWDIFPESAKFLPVQCWAQAVNWLPWLLSLAWLAWLAARMPGGWKLYWITVVVLTLCAPAVKMEVLRPWHGPHPGLVYITFYDGIPYFISSTIQHVLGHLPYIGPRFQAWVDDWLDAHQPMLHAPPQTVALIQTAIIGLGAIMFYLKASSGRRTTDVALVAGGLVMCWVLWSYGGSGMVL